MSKALEELRKVIDFRVEVLAKEISGSGDEASPAGLAAGHILAVGLSARRNMCVHPEVSKEGDRERVDEMCRQLTAPWAREKGKTSGCAHFEKQGRPDVSSEVLLFPICFCSCDAATLDSNIVFKLGKLFTHHKS